MNVCSAILWSAICLSRASLAQATFLEATFDTGLDGFVYADDVFRGTNQPSYASGNWSQTAGVQGGGLRVALGGIDDQLAIGISGGFRAAFHLPHAAAVDLMFTCKLEISAEYETSEYCQVLTTIDGVLRGQPPYDHVIQLVGDGNGGAAFSSDWKAFQVHLGVLAQGSHTVTVGGYNNRKNRVNESAELFIDDVQVASGTAGNAGVAAARIVARLDSRQYKSSIATLASFGDRRQGTSRLRSAGVWVEQELQAMGYQTERHPYDYLGRPRTNLYATKVGMRFPDRMFIVSAHLDGRGGGGAADDDASGCALVLEAARALARPGVETDLSVRFIFWNNEETGLQGSSAYVLDRLPLQGQENPPGSGIYPEPMWHGMIQHDMLLFDHGLPPQPNQIAAADVDIEYQIVSTNPGVSLALANAMQGGNGAYSTDYPAEIGSNMMFTDSFPFRNFTATVSVRENQRVAEIGQGSNPHWHQLTDVYSTYSEADFQLGFNALQMTLGTVSQYACASWAPSVNPYGVGCVGSGGTPSLAVAAGQLPWLGGSFVLALTSLPTSSSNQAFAFFGLSNVSWNGLLLPFDLGAVGMPGCSLHASADLVGALSHSGGSANWTIPIPADPRALDVPFYLQALVIDGGVNLLGATVSNALACTPGVR